MKHIFDPVEGGNLRAVLNILATALGASFAVAEVADEPWAKITLIALAALVGIVQAVTHSSAYGNIQIGDLP